MLLALVLALAASPPTPSSGGAPSTGRLVGVVRTAGDPGLLVVAVEERLPPRIGARRHHEIAQFKKKFTPNALVVEVGDVVKFPNRDKVFHNVFSPADSGGFDLGMHGPESTDELELNVPGEVILYCNIHADMQAHVLVVPSPKYVVVGKDGWYELDGLTPGRLKVLVWSNQLEPIEQRVTVVAGADTTANFHLAVPRSATTHLKKDGSTYDGPRYFR